MITAQVYFTLLGILFGSFLYTVVLRMHRGARSILFERSACPHCKTTLTYRDLIPIISYAITQGHCRYCKTNISLKYPLIEILGGAGYFLIITHFWYIEKNNVVTIHSILQNITANYNVIILLLAFSALLVISFYDLEFMQVPDIIAIPTIFLLLGYIIVNQEIPFLDHIIATLIPIAMFLTIILISRGKWMGGGDLRVGIIMALLLGVKLTLIALFLSFLSGAIIGSFILLYDKKTNHLMPFAPFLATATIICLLYGPEIINFYLNIFYL